VRDAFDLLGLNIGYSTLDEVVERTRDALDQGSCAHLAVVNANKISRCRHDPLLRQHLKAADALMADGVSIQWAARWLGQPMPPRVTGVDLMAALMADAAHTGRRPYLLGARPSVVSRAARQAVARNPGLKLAGWHHGFFPPSHAAAVVEQIRQSRPDMLFVALGTPTQEHFIQRWKTELGVPLTLGVGGSIDVLAEQLSRAPALLRRVGLEWAWRIGHQPTRGPEALRHGLRFTADVYHGDPVG
jgi:N-acetylglucosaminyldiphosphoundecaprenol N-acetyl-beta-D-mannosaminyltransferase